MAQLAHPRPLAGSLAALRRVSEVGVLAVAPALLALAVIGGAIGNRYAFDFHGALWQAARDVLDGRNPYPPPTAAGVAPGDRFVYPPPVALLLVPFGLLPFPVAAAIITVVLIAAVAATLAVLGVRDWRCYGAAYLSIAVLHDIRLGALTPLLAFGLALVWRWREQARAVVPLALIMVAKLFLWPLTVWLVATGRVRLALRGVVLAVLASALAWALIGFAGLVEYPKLLQRSLGRGAGPWLLARLGWAVARPRAGGRTGPGIGCRRCAARLLLARGAPRPRPAFAGARTGGCARALADRVAALLRAAARPDRNRAAHVRRDLADPGAVLVDTVRGALRAALAHRGRHRGVRRGAGRGGAGCDDPAYDAAR